MNSAAFTIETVDHNDVPESTRGKSGSSKYEPIARRLLSLPDGKAIRISADKDDVRRLLIAAPNLHRIKATSLYRSGYRVRTRKSGSDLYLWLEPEDVRPMSSNGVSRHAATF